MSSVLVNAPEAQTNPHPGRHSGDRVHTCAPMKRLFSESGLGINTVNRMSLGSAARWRGCACLRICVCVCISLRRGGGFLSCLRSFLHTVVVSAKGLLRETRGNGSIASSAHDRQRDPTFPSSQLIWGTGAFQQHSRAVWTFKKRHP